MISVAWAHRCSAWYQTFKSDMNICTLCYLLCLLYIYGPMCWCERNCDNWLSLTIADGQDNIWKKRFVAGQQTQESTMLLARTWQLAVTHSHPCALRTQQLLERICLCNNFLPEFVEYVEHTFAQVAWHMGLAGWGTVNSHWTIPHSVSTMLMLSTTWQLI